MAKYDFDLFVIGGGSGGVRAARISAELGARVAVAEHGRFGGTCVIRGCVPKKLFVYASHYAEEFEDARGYGWTIEGTRFDWPTLIRNKDNAIAHLSGIYRKAVDRAGVAIFEDRAVLKDAHTVHLAKAGRAITSEHILIATGGSPSRNLAGAPGAECCITSDDAFHLECLPKDIVIAGGGYIAVEFAHIFFNLGVETTVVYRGPKILRGFDEELRDMLQDSMQKKGIKLVLGSIFAGCEHVDGRVRARLTSGDSLEAEQVMLAIGRAPNTSELGLEHAGVELGDHGAIVVDELSRSSVPNIYAIGDVTNRLNLTPVAIHDAVCFARTVFGHAPTPPDHNLVATAVFSQPEIGAIGLTEEAARAKGYTVDTYKTNYRPLRHALSGRAERALMKLVVDAKTDRVLGCHIFADEAAELVQLVAVAMKMGATKAQFDAAVAVHPTAAEELVTMRNKVAGKPPEGANEIA
ncbi:MAG: glutathione-disulfide reductase [Alphaproteobacteria bacterium]